MTPRKTKTTCEFGDFQTPDELAVKALAVLKGIGCAPASVVEPTCGIGAFVIATQNVFSGIPILAGEVNEQYVTHLRERLERGRFDGNATVMHCNFFETDWQSEVAKLPRPLLIVGNYPWVTSAALGAIQSSNLPKKSNFRGYSGIDAVMGKSNFDISEWMLLQNLQWLDGRSGAIAMLCKTAIARKILDHTWKHKVPVKRAHMYGIDAMTSFNAAVDACFFFLEVGPNGKSQDCLIFENLDSEIPTNIIGYHDKMVVSNVECYLSYREFCGRDTNYVWRSGIKHDCSRVMELTYTGSGYVNGYNETVEIEDSLLYPMLKSSDLGGRHPKHRQKFMIVTQRTIGESTASIARIAPHTWQYLRDNATVMADRGSTIYNGKPQFSIFGVGDYTFSPWKVAISGFYKSLGFRVIGPKNGKPIVFDDTIYFLACWSEDEARLLHKILMSTEVQKLLDSMVFWNSKRPITVDLLKRINLKKVAEHLGIGHDYIRHTSDEHISNIQMMLPLGSVAN